MAEEEGKEEEGGGQASVARQGRAGGRASAGKAEVAGGLQADREEGRERGGAWLKGEVPAGSAAQPPAASKSDAGARSAGALVGWGGWEVPGSEWLCRAVLRLRRQRINRGIAQRPAGGGKM